MFTIILIAVGALFVVAAVAHEIRSWRKPGHNIRLNASSDDDQVNRARLIQETNIHKQNPFGGSY